MEKSPAHYLFIDDAMLYGVPEALLLSHIRHNVNRKKLKPEKYKEYFINGRFWFHNTRKEFTDIHPYWTERQVRTLLTNLLNAGILMSGCFNKRGYDKTLWYTINDEVDALNSKNLLLPSDEKVIDVQDEHDENDSMYDYPMTDISLPLTDKSLNIDTIVTPIPIIDPVIYPIIEKADKKDCLQKESIITKKTGVKKSALKINHIPVDDNTLPGSKSAQEIIDMVKTKAVNELDDLNYLFEITPFQILNPKHPDVVNASYKKVKLNHITGDLAKLYRRLVIKNHPNMGTLPEINIKDYGLIKTTMIKLSGSVELLRLIIIHWTTFKSLVEAEHGAKIKDKYPNLLVITKYAGIAASSVFLGKTSKGVSPDLFANAMTLEKALK